MFELGNGQSCDFSRLSRDTSCMSRDTSCMLLDSSCMSRVTFPLFVPEYR